MGFFNLSGKIGEIKNEKRNDMGVGVYGCMPCSGGEKKGIRPHKEKGCSWCGRNGVWIFEVLSPETKNKS